MTVMLGYSIKAWWIAIGLPIVGFMAASAVGVILALMVIGTAAECRRRWLAGARERDLRALHRGRR